MAPRSRLTNRQWLAIDLLALAALLTLFAAAVIAWPEPIPDAPDADLRDPWWYVFVES